VLYAEDDEESPAPFPGIGSRIAEMLIDHVTLRLAVRRPGLQAPAQPSSGGFTPARQARRLRVRDSVEVTVDGVESSLVDVSSIGAQILSSAAMRPNKVLRMVLRHGDRTLSCKSRVMWARFEPAKGSAEACYRVGVKFTDVDQQSVEAFLSDPGVAEASR
jgi:hypothetical protein